MSIKQLNFESKDKVEVAIDLIKGYEPPDGYYLANSGGKDSVVIQDLAERAGVKFDAHYNVSPLDPQEIRDFLKRVYPDVIWDRTAKGFWREFLIQGPPMRNQRWCCGYIKEAGGMGRVKIMGMRRAESSKRAHYQTFMPHLRRADSFWLLPIVSWTDKEVWEYINFYHLPTCPLYQEGFKRLGCILCPFESRAITIKSLARFPRIVKCWRLAFERYYQARIERGTPLDFKSVDEYWEWWLSRNKRGVLMDNREDRNERRRDNPW